MASAFVQQTIDMQLRHPVSGAPLWQDDDGEKPITIKLAGADSTRFRKAERVNRDRRLKGMRMRPPTAEELDAEGMELLTKCTLGWSGIVLDGQRARIYDAQRQDALQAAALGSRAGRQFHG